MTKKNQKLNAADLPIVLYLNQRLTFDLLATLQGGFSSLSTVQTTSSGESTTDTTKNVGLGVSNTFAFLGVNFGAQRSNQTGQQESESRKEQIVHTPASLFARLRNELHNHKLVSSVSKPSDLEYIKPGQFVEFEATIQKCSLTDVLDSFLQMLPLTKLEDKNYLLSKEGKGSRKPQRQTSKQQPDEFQILTSQIELFKSVVASEGTHDFIAEVDSLKVVLPMEPNYLVNPTMNDIIDGTFRVFGKATRVVLDKNDKISLFRKSAIGDFKEIGDSLIPLKGIISESGFTGSIETEIVGPTMQVIPISIFS